MFISSEMNKHQRIISVSFRYYARDALLTVTQLDLMRSVGCNAAFHDMTSRLCIF